MNDMLAFQAVSAKKPVRDIIRLFDRMPFTAIWVAGFTPVPFFPIRFLVVMAGYPVAKYLLAVFLSRAPRFFILAIYGEFFDVPGILLVGVVRGNVGSGQRPADFPVPRSEVMLDPPPEPVPVGAPVVSSFTAQQRPYHPTREAPNRFPSPIP